MTEQRDTATAEPGSGVVEAVGRAAVPATISRRAILRGATVAVPTVLTLHSGAALALASSYVTTTATADPVGDNYVCLSGAQPGTPYYYGDGANAWGISATQLYVDADCLLTVINPTDADEVAAAIAAAPRVTGQQLCADGKWYIPVDNFGVAQYTSPAVPRQVQVPQGAMMSAAAYTSVEASGKLNTKLLI